MEQSRWSATAVFLIIGIDRWGRKKKLIGGAAWMASMMFIIGAVLATHPPNAKATSVSYRVHCYGYHDLFICHWILSILGPNTWVYLGEVSFLSH